MANQLETQYCKNCNSPFTQIGAGRKQLFCSDKCGTAWRRKPENIPHAYEFTCKNCGKTYWQVDKRRNQFCSVPCMNEYHRENQKQKPLKPLKPLNTCVVS